VERKTNDATTTGELKVCEDEGNDDKLVARVMSNSTFHEVFFRFA
jgi:hypothetical protein